MALVLAALGELLALGPPALEVAFDDLAVGAGAGEDEARGIDLALAFGVSRLAACFLGNRLIQLPAPAGDELVRAGELCGRCSRGEQCFA